MRRSYIIWLIVLIFIGVSIMAEVKSDGATRLQSNDGKVNIGISSNQVDMTIPVDGVDRLRIANDEVKLSQEGIPVQSSTDQESIINNTNNVFKIIAKFDVTIPAISMPDGSSGSTSASIDLSAYPVDSIILPIARVPGQPSFIWQGEQGLLGASNSGFVAGWSVLASYYTSFTGGGQMQLTRNINNASGSPYDDGAYNITVYVLQEQAG